jgi:hypothetical protein
LPHRDEVHFDALITYETMPFLTTCWCIFFGSEPAAISVA